MVNIVNYECSYTLTIRGKEASLEMLFGEIRESNNVLFSMIPDSGEIKFDDGSYADAMSIEVSPNVAKKFAQEIIRLADKKLNEMNVGTVTTHGGKS